MTKRNQTKYPPKLRLTKIFCMYQSAVEREEQEFRELQIEAQVVKKYKKRR